MIGIDLLGVGHMGSIRARSIAAHCACEMIRVIDQALDRARRVAEICGGTPDASTENAFRNDRVEAVVVASSTSAQDSHVLSRAVAGKAPRDE